MDDNLIKARLFIFECIQGARPIDREYLTQLTGKRDGALHQFITSTQTQLPPSRVSKAAKSGKTVQDGWAALASAIYMPEQEGDP